MFFFNLSLPEFLALLGSASAVVVALYLLDRHRNRHTVPTLRFFAASEMAPVLKHRRKLQQPWSLVLQLVSLLLLLLAIAQLRWGSPALSTRDHVLIIDSSAWMAARSGSLRLIDQARSTARAYVQRLPSTDRVMVLRADALATPATLFETDRTKIRQAIDQTQPSAAPLSIQSAIEFAQQAQKLRTGHVGEIVFVGAGRVDREEAAFQTIPPNFRFIPVASPSEHCGLRKVSVRRSMEDPDLWEIFIGVKNYGVKPRTAPLGVQFGGAPVATRTIDLKPSAEENVTFRFKTQAAGILEARLFSHDVFDQDTRTTLELPARNLLAVTVYSTDPGALKPIFTAIPGIQAAFRPPSAYDGKIDHGIVLLDHFAPPAPPRTDSIWIEPPAQASPIPVRSMEKNLKLARWSADHPLGAGLRAKDIEVASAETFRTSTNDIVVAESEAGPLVVARPSKPRSVVLGFQPARSGLEYELATPLLFANILRWMAPDIFRSWELTAGTVGTVSAELDTEPDPSAIRVVTEDGRPLPFTVQARTVRFFAAGPGIVRVFAGDREMVYSLTLPQPGDTAWKPSRATIGLPDRVPPEPGSRDLWQWLALLGAIGLLADWILFGRMQRGAMPVFSRIGTPWRKAS